MRPPGNSNSSTVIFADQIQPPNQIHHQQQQQQYIHQRHNGPNGGRRVQIVDSFYPPPQNHHHPPKSNKKPQQISSTNGHTNANNRMVNSPSSPCQFEQNGQMRLPSISSPVPTKSCQCCPFGFHIDLGFVKFAEDVAAGKEQIQNWSSPSKKLVRRLLVSPSSDRTILDISGCSENANISNSYPNDSSIMSKSLEIDDNLPELVEHHQQTISLPYSTNANNRIRAPSVPITTPQHQHHPQGILKNADWQNGNYGTARAAPIPINNSRNGGREEYQLQQRINPTYSQQNHYFIPQQQHQSRFYDAHVHHQQQQHRRRYPLSMPSEQQFPMSVGSPSTFVGPPLRTSTPRSNDEFRHPLHISTAMVNQPNQPQMNGDGTTNSAPSSPIPKPNGINYQTSIAQSMAQLRKTPQKGLATATFSTKSSQAHTSLSALSSMARNAFTNPPITTRRYYLESGGTRRVLSPEPHLPSMGDGAVRSSNLQSRTFFHKNQNGQGIANRMPYRSRGVGSAPHIGPSPYGGSSTLELGEFASIRRRRLDADIGGSTTLHSAHLIRSISPPIHFPLSAYSSTNSPSSGNSLPRANDQQEKHSSLANLLPELSEFYDEGTLKVDKLKKRKSSAPAQKEYQIPVQNVQACLLKHSGTQTPPKPFGKEIGILTERQQNEQKKPPTPPPMTPKMEMKEIGISASPEPLPVFGISPTAELPFSGLIQFASVGVDTEDLEKMDEKERGKKVPPRPPPKPSGPDLEAKLRRRRQQELMGNLVAEFQYCLGHEPEHHPDYEPPLLQKNRKFVEKGQQVKIMPETEDFGVDAFKGKNGEHNSIATSTTDLRIKSSKKDVSIGTLLAAKMIEIGVETEPKAIWEIGIQTEDWAKEEEEEKKDEFGVEMRKEVEKRNAETQTENGWLEAEIGRRLAEAEAERKEKRKRNSAERSTETDEEEAPDQFIMITCNKCEQRSSVASDELFEKILAPEEAEEMRIESNQQELAEMAEAGISQKSLEMVKEEPEFVSSHEEIKIPETLELVKAEESKEIIVVELRRSKEFKSTEMWKFVNTEEEQIIFGEIPKANEMPKLVIEEFGGNVIERIQQNDELTTKRLGPSPTFLSSQIDQIFQRQNDGTTKKGGKKESTSPLISDEGLVLGEEDFMEPTELLGEFELEADRISVETDVQTVICVEQSGNGARSSSSASSKTPTTPSTSNNGESISARTEALRKLLTEPPRRQAFQRDVDSNRSYRSDKSKQLDLEYIADRHKSTEAQQSEPSTPCSSTQTKKALKETISLKKSPPSTLCAAPGVSSSNAVFPPDPIPARIPRPKIARYSPNVSIAETPDEEAEAADRLTPLRSEMRSLSAWVSPTSSPRMSQRSLIFRTQIGGPLEEEEEVEDEEDLEVEGATSSSSSKEQLPQDPPEEEDASSTSSDGARTYEMSDDENAEFFELSAPLRDALETINDFLLEGIKTSTANRRDEREEEQQQKGNQIEWAQKYAQHEWLKMATKKNANAELVDQFIDALESFSTQSMDTVINMTDQNGNTALHYAVSNENFEVVSVLLDSKVSRVDQMNKAGYSALMLGALCELRNETECAIMQRLFQMGNVNAKAVKHSQTALMLAASHGRVESTNLLLKCGADVNIQDIDGSTALMCAAEHGQKEIVKILLKQPNIDASLTDCDNQTALSIAIENQHRDIGVLIYAHLNFSRLAETSGENSVLI